MNMNLSCMWKIHEKYTNSNQHWVVYAEVLHSTLSDIHYVDELQQDWYLQRLQSPQWL